MGSSATEASRILNLQLRTGSSHSGPSLVPHWKPYGFEKKKTINIESNRGEIQAFFYKKIKKCWVYTVVKIVLQILALAKLLKTRTKDTVKRQKSKPDTGTFFKNVELPARLSAARPLAASC